MCRKRASANAKRSIWWPACGPSSTSAASCRQILRRAHDADVCTRSSCQLRVDVRLNCISDRFECASAFRSSRHRLACGNSRDTEGKGCAFADLALDPDLAVELLENLAARWEDRARFLLACRSACCPPAGSARRSSSDPSWRCRYRCRAHRPVTLRPPASPQVAPNPLPDWQNFTALEMRLTITWVSRSGST